MCLGAVSLEIGENGRTILVGLETGCGRPEGEAAMPRIEESLAELARLAQTAGLCPVRRVIQRRDTPDSAFFVGRGKAEQLAAAAGEDGCRWLVFDDELSGVQLRNLEELTGCEILDRTQLILGIFAMRARSREGKFQVQLAELLYRLPRLTGRGGELSRLGGGIGTRGPGETQLEADRRAIRTRISSLRREIGALRRHRALHREGRRRIPLPVIALVGYTNAGKSTLLNRLTGATVRAEDRLFATVDPTTRGFRLPEGGRVLLTDTVGFIRKLPHTLVAAFRATLEEAVEADLLWHVIDISHPEAVRQAEVVCEVLEEIGAGGRPVVHVLNKVDLAGLAPEAQRVRRRFPAAPAVSALTGEGLSSLLEATAYALRDWYEELSALIPYRRGDLLSVLHDRGRVESEVFEAEGVRVRAVVDKTVAARIRSELAGTAVR